ncbi:hypothetical protein CEXT_115221 [Caerostris extrusa]|uniref:Uncharacterized protein n=1 Tax=Caerostris extrusa TaxID=172846 RepID=A0AAV4Y3P9_CAEEX|nr:hypothetical protein CEXT_115221 [Caerostris extrusa]
MVAKRLPQHHKVGVTRLGYYISKLAGGRHLEELGGVGRERGRQRAKGPLKIDARFGRHGYRRRHPIRATVAWEYRPEFSFRNWRNKKKNKVLKVPFLCQAQVTVVRVGMEGGGGGLKGWKRLVYFF